MELHIRGPLVGPRACEVEGWPKHMTFARIHENLSNSPSVERVGLHGSSPLAIKDFIPELEF